MEKSSRERTNELVDRITQLTLKTTEQEPERLFAELSAIEQRQVNWNKAAWYVGGATWVVVFLISDTKPDIWFHNDAILLGLILGFVVGAVVFIALAMIGVAMMRAQVNDWARRAEIVVQAHDGGAPISTTINTNTAAPKLKPQPPPLSQFQKILWSSGIVFGLISLGAGFYTHIGRLVGLGSALVLVSLMQLFHRPDR